MYLRYSGFMFEEGDTLQQPAAGQKAGSVWKVIVAVVILLAAGLGGGMLVAHDVLDGRITIPKSITQNAAMPVVVPRKLPGTYKIAGTSFNLKEKVVVFEASDGTGGKINFTEQQKPAGFNFDNFYAQQLQDPTTLNDVPFSSVVGQLTGTKTKMLSVVTDKTWVIATTTAPLSTDDMQIIAQSIKK